MLMPDLNNLDAGAEYVETCIENVAKKSAELAKLRKETQSTYLSDLEYALSEAGLLNMDRKNRTQNVEWGGGNFISD